VQPIFDQVTGVLLVRERKGGPVVFVKWRDTDGRQLMRRLGVGWLVPKGARGGKPAGARIGGWVERRGRPPADVLDVRAAHDAMRALIDAHEDELAAERRRRDAVREPGVTFARAAEAWLHWGVTDREWKYSTADDYRRCTRRICAVIGDRLMTALTEDDLRALLAQLEPMRNGQPLDHPPSVRMATKYTTIVRSVCALAEERGWVDVSPARQLKSRRRRGHGKNHAVRREQYLTPEEVHAVVRAAEPEDAAFIVTLAFTGLRLGEGMALRWQDVDFSRASIHVERNLVLGRFGTPKSGFGRTVPMADEVAQALARHGQRNWLTAPDDLVFIGKKGRPIDENRFRKRYYAAQEAVGIRPRRTVHMLRHTFATVCASHGIPLRTIQGWCGHEEFSTTERYAHLMPRHEDAALVSAAFGAGSPAQPAGSVQLIPRA
jgi:integrase